MTKHFDPVPLNTIRTKSVRYLPRYEGRFEFGTLTPIAAPPGTGKGLVSVAITARISQTHRVLYSSFEDPDAIAIKPRMKAAGANLDNIVLFSPILPEGIDQWEREITAANSVLSVLDTVGEHMTHRTTDDVRVRDTLLQATEMLERTQTSAIGIIHPNKRIARNAHPLQIVGGASSGWAGVPRQVCLLMVDPDDPTQLVLTFSKANNGPKPTSLCFEFDACPYADVADEDDPEDADTTVAFLRETGESPLTAEDAVRSYAASGKPGGSEQQLRPKRAAASELLWATLASGEVPKPQVLEEAQRHGISQITLERAFREMGGQHRKNGYQGVMLWRLPDDARELQLDEQLEADQ
jgi:hypothetical protein